MLAVLKFGVYDSDSYPIKEEWRSKENDDLVSFYHFGKVVVHL